MSTSSTAFAEARRGSSAVAENPGAGTESGPGSRGASGSGARSGSGANPGVPLLELEVSATAGPDWLGTGPATLRVCLAAETVRFDATHLHFIAGDSVVRSVPRGDVTALTWRGLPARKRPPGQQHRNAGALWTDEEREQLRTEVYSDMSWTDISQRHGRTVTAVRREAVRARLVDELGRRLDLP